MMSKTHKVIAVSTAAIFNLNIAYMVGAWLFSTLPDIDFKYGHRKFTHSILALGAFSFLTYQIWEPLGICFVIGYGSHIVADSFTKMGVQLLYPYKKMMGLKIMKTGDTADWFIFYGCLAFLLKQWLGLG